MKLIIKRDQDKAFMGGMNFLLQCRVELEPREIDLIKKYKAQDEVIATIKAGKEYLKIGNLINGVNYKTKDITTLMSDEDDIKEACKKFKNYLLVMATFGGEETIDI